MPHWVTEGVTEYSKRLQAFTDLEIIELPLQKRTHKPGDLAKIREKESQLMQAAIPASAYCIALAIEGKSFSSEKLSQKLEQLQQQAPHLCLLIGGPEGLSDDNIRRCRELWSLSPLTLPHPLARIIVLESLYRAFAIHFNHPYHK